MTPKQERFVSEYLIDLNATQAAIRAGYSEKTANEQGARLLANASIRGEVTHRQQAVAGKLELTHEWVLTKLVENLERALQAIAVLDHEGKPTGVYQYQGNVANRALELIGKHLGTFPERIIISDPTQLTDEELRHQADEAKRKLRLIA